MSNQGRVSGFFVAVSAVLLFSSPSWSADLLRFKPSDDTSVNKSYPSKIYGGGSSLRIDTTPDTRILLKFPVQGIGTRRVLKATLKLYVKNSSSQGGNLYRLGSTSWSEGAVTYSSMPSFGSTLIASIGDAPSSQWKSADLTSIVSADGVYGIGIKGEVSDGCEYASKEDSSGANSPVLEVELEPLPSPTPTSTPTATPSPSPVSSLDMGYRAIFDATQYIDSVACKPQSAYKDWSIRKSSGGRAFRFELHQGEARMDSNDIANGKDRTEIKHGTTYPMGKEIWESHSFNIEPGALMTSTWNVMGQWHPGAGTPALFFTLSTNDNLLIGARYGSSTSQKRLDLYQQPIKRGVWHHVVQHVTFGYQNNASVQIWLDGKLIVDKKGISVGYSDSDGVYWKFGIYRNTTSVVTAVQFANVEIGSLSLLDRVAHPLEIKP